MDNIKKILKITLIAAVALAVAFAWPTQVVIAPVQAVEIIEIPTSTLPVILRDGSPQNPTIPWCESRNQQFNADGTIKRGVINPQDIGKYQINLTHHGARARELGIDLYTEEGNTLFAILLYNESGTTPWNWSKRCWL